MTVGLLHLPQRCLIAAVRAYRLLLSPWLGSRCRFEPTCSAYSLQALEAHGAVTGVWLTTGRLLRCGPWCEGGHDPVPGRPLLQHGMFPFVLPRSSARPAPTSDPSHPPIPGPHP